MVVPRIKSRHIPALLVVAGILIFQNCSSPPDESTNTGSNSFQAKLPLAVESTVDTIAYMSCSNVSGAPEARTYFTFRVGAYNNTTGGMKMTDEFREATKYYNATERARSFAGGNANTGTRLNLSIRAAANYQQIWKADELRYGEEIEAFSPPLDSAVMAGPLAASNPGEQINYFPGPHTQRLMEASLRYFKFENVMKDTRTKLETRGGTDSAYLVVGYSGGADDLNTSLRGPANAAAGNGLAAPVYGKGYLLSFGLYKGMSSGERRVLSTAGLTEVNLATSPPSPVNAIWDCSADYQVTIIRPEDWVKGNVVTCNPHPDISYAPGTINYNRMVALRRVLRVEDWFIDLDNNCVLPKRTPADLCYGPSNDRSVQYGSATCSDSTTTMCPHYVSVCIRR
ncbi:MAG: hypothetical protein AB7F86_03515 [Bdellovibrionales bacterium]